MEAGCMEAYVHGDVIWTKTTKNLEKRGFGVKREDKIVLHPVEAVYLSFKEIITVKKGDKLLSPEEVLEWCTGLNPSFTPMYFVYYDLRERGYRVRPEEGMLVGREFFIPVSEREHLNLCGIMNISHMKPVLAVVDEESEVTYFRVYEPDMAGRQKEEIERFSGVFAGDRVVTDNRDVFEKHFYGSFSGTVTLSLIESLYLLESRVLDVFSGGEKLTFQELWKVSLSLEDNLERRYSVYKDLKSRKFVVKTGFKFGGDFRLYEEVKGVEELPHSTYLVSIADRPMPMREVARAVRLAQNVRKKMVFVFSDGKKNRYLCIERIRV